MKIVLAALLGLGSAAWAWGAFSGRLSSMIAAAISPSWLQGQGTAAPSATSPPPGSGGM